VIADIATVLGAAETERAFRQLRRVLGEEELASLLRQCHVAAGGGSITTATDLMRLANALTEVGGFIGVVGRSFRVASICRGAKP
jgi:hypothetical protein